MSKKKIKVTNKSTGKAYLVDEEATTNTNFKRTFNSEKSELPEELKEEKTESK